MVGAIEGIGASTGTGAVINNGAIKGAVVIIDPVVAIKGIVVAIKGAVVAIEGTVGAIEGTVGAIKGTVVAVVAAGSSPSSADFVVGVSIAGTGSSLVFMRPLVLVGRLRLLVGDGD